MIHFRHCDILAKTRSRMTTATKPRQNDAGSRARTTWIWNLKVSIVFYNVALETGPNQSHNAIRHNTDQDSNATCKWPIGRQKK